MLIEEHRAAFVRYCAALRVLDDKGMDGEGPDVEWTEDVSGKQLPPSVKRRRKHLRAL